MSVGACTPSHSSLHPSITLSLLFHSPPRQYHAVHDIITPLQQCHPFTTTPLSFLVYPEWPCPSYQPSLPFCPCKSWHCTCTLAAGRRHGFRERFELRHQRSSQSFLADHATHDEPQGQRMRHVWLSGLQCSLSMHAVARQACRVPAFCGTDSCVGTRVMQVQHATPHPVSPAGRFAPLRHRAHAGASARPLLQPSYQSKSHFIEISLLRRAVSGERRWSSD